MAKTKSQCPGEQKTYLSKKILAGVHPTGGGGGRHNNIGLASPKIINHVFPYTPKHGKQREKLSSASLNQIPPKMSNDVSSQTEDSK